MPIHRNQLKLFKEGGGVTPLDMACFTSCLRVSTHSGEKQHLWRARVDDNLQTAHSMPPTEEGEAARTYKLICAWRWFVLGAGAGWKVENMEVCAWPWMVLGAGWKVENVEAMRLRPLFHPASSSRRQAPRGQQRTEREDARAARGGPAGPEPEAEHEDFFRQLVCPLWPVFARSGSHDCYDSFNNSSPGQ